VGCGRLEIRLSPGGRANFFTTEDCCVLVDTAVLNQINSIASIVIATTPNFSFAPAGKRIATMKSAPFAVEQSHLETMINILKERGPILQARPVRAPSVAILYTDQVDGDRARRLFESILRERLQRFGTAASFVLASMEEEEAVARNLRHLLRAKPTVILVASTTAPAGPADVIGRGMTRIGCHLERFLAPVEPGNLFMLGYKDEIPILSAPGCFRSAKPNVIDLVLPPMLARYRISAWEVAGLGHGGLLG
jgi:molybdenum cofactor cytidylyltransferase